MLVMAVLLPLSSLSAAAPSAQSTISGMVAKLKKEPSFDIIFTVWNNGNSYNGSMIVSNSRFTLSTPQMKVWFDGKTQWSYAPDVKEVNITEPTADELLQINPLAIVNSLGQNYDMRRLKSNPGEDKIQLTPKKRNPDFASVVITIDSKTSLPKEIALKPHSGQSTIIRFSSFKPGKTLPQATFRFNPSKFPGVEIVDLR